VEGFLTLTLGDGALPRCLQARLHFLYTGFQILDAGVVGLFIYTSFQEEV
jgi:hypothetical protein